MPWSGRYRGGEGMDCPRCKKKMLRFQASAWHWPVYMCPRCGYQELVWWWRQYRGEVTNGRW